MNLISTDEKSSYQIAMQGLHDTFSRDITLVKQVKTPREGESNEDDDYDFTQDHNTGTEEFVITESESTVKARIKYLEKQEKEFALGGDKLNLTQDFGFLRIKVRIEDSQSVIDATRIIVDGNSCHIFFRDRPHGMLDVQFATFYLQRTP